MELSLTVTLPSGEEQVDVDLTLDSVEATVRVVELLGEAGPLADLAQGIWNADAARAILFVNLTDRYPFWPLNFDQFTVDFGDTPVSESDIPMENI